MEDSSKTKFVNLSNRKFESYRYADEIYSGLGYKFNKAFWLAKESKKPDYFSRWDEEYGDVSFDENMKKMYVTTTMYSDDTLVISPSVDSKCTEYLEEFVKFLDKKRKTTDRVLSDSNKRKLLVDYLKDKKVIPENIKYLVCQIDLAEDEDVIERVFGNYKFGEENEDSIYQNLQYNVRKGLRECFSAVEVTDFALGNDPMADEDMSDHEVYKQAIDPKYNGDLGFWDVHSIAVFDTRCIKVIDEKVVDYKKIIERRNKEEIR